MGCFIGKDSNQNEDINIVEEKSSKSRVTNIDEQIMSLSTQIRKVKEYKTKMENLSNQMTEKAKEHLKKKEQQKALFSLKMKKLYKSNEDKCYSVITTLEQAKSNIESAVMDNSVITVMKESNDLLTDLRSKSKLEDFESIYESLQEHKEDQEKITNLLQMNDLEGDELKDELVKLGENQNEEDLNAYMNKLDKINVPSNKIQIESSNTEAKEENRPNEERVAILS